MTAPDSAFCDLGQRSPGEHACQDCGISDALIGHPARCTHPVYQAAREAGEYSKAAQLAELLADNTELLANAGQHTPQPGEAQRAAV